VKQLLDRTPQSDRVAAAAALNAEITAGEIAEVLRRMHNGRMAGPDKWPAELFRFAFDRVQTLEGYWRHDYLLCDDLCKLFQHVFVSGALPPVWCSAILCPVFKKGDPADLDNYRGISVGSVLGKMYSMVLESRLDGFCEAHGHRAAGQAGFRKKRCCSDHIFVLKHLIDVHRAERGKHLFVCFVDFRKAYDMVRRDLLMECLADMGLHGHMLEALCSMYWCPTLCVKFGQQLGEPFESTRGVKQGDPLSPLLFGVFFDRIERWFAERAPASGVQLGSEQLRMLLYADDLALIAQSKHMLQFMLKQLADFCDTYDLEVNVAKTCVVVFGKKRYSGSRFWIMRGRRMERQQVPVATEFKYLGVVFHETKGSQHVVMR